MNMNKIEAGLALIDRYKNMNRECANRGFIQSGNNAAEWLQISKQLSQAQNRMRRLLREHYNNGDLSLEMYSTLQNRIF